MKLHVLFLTFFSIPAVLFSQQSIAWESELMVADGAAYGVLRPRMALTENDVPVVVLGKAGGELYVARMNGNAFDIPVALLPGTMESYVAGWTGPDIAAIGNTVIVVFKAETLMDGDIYAVRSTDGGVTFSDTIRVDNHQEGRTMMPALDLDAAGNPVVTYLAFDENELDPKVAVVHSTDGGLTFNPQELISETMAGEACDCCPPEMVINGNYQLTLFRNNASNLRDVWGILSEDNGVNFGSTANLNELDWFVNTCPSTGPHGVIIGDTAYVVSASQASSAYRVYVSAVGLSGGLNLEHALMVDPPTSMASDTQNFPRISGEGDTLVMVWEEKESSNTNVLYSLTTNGSVADLTSTKFRVHQNTAGVQAKPDVIYKNGFVHVIYQDLTTNDVMYRRGTIVNAVGVEELASQLAVYPNPAHDVITIENTSGTSIEGGIYDLSGREISTFRSEQPKTELRIEHLLPGMYVVRSGSFSMPFFKE